MDAATGVATPENAKFAELENETRRESKLKPPYLQKTDQFSCLNFALEWRRYSRARGKSIDISQHLLELENQVLAWRQLAEPTTADELFTPFEDVLSINKTTYGEPRHGLDLARDLLLNVDIRGIQLHVDPHILSSWKSDGTIANSLCNWAIWERIIISSQFESPQIADNALAECRMDWDKSWSSNKERWDDFLRRFTIVANMSTMIELNTTQLYCFEARDILKYFAHNIGIPIIRSDTKIFFKDKASFAQLSTVEVFKDLKDRYLNWCSQNIQRQNIRFQYISDARFLDTTRPSTPPITDVPRYNKLKNFRPSFDSDSDSDVRNRNPRKKSHKRGQFKGPRGPGKNRQKPKHRDTGSESVCKYCKEPGHTVEMCPDPNCRVSSLNAGKFEERKRRSGSGNVDLKRNKNDNYLNFCRQPRHQALTPHTHSTILSAKSSTIQPGL
ncbi:hypothetical protein GEMRC1_002304 [Eukaryota sp. GEM-RC1]